VSWRDRVSLTAGLRLDDLEVPVDPAWWVFYIPLPPFPSSTPPAEPGMTLYPAVGLIVAPVVARWGILDRLRLRLGYGSAGRRFGLLAPERTNELEFSAGATLLNGRAAFEARGYSRTTRDAFTPALIPTSSGFLPAVAQGARVSNRGLEVTVTAVPARSDHVAWDVTLGAWGNRNRLTTLPVPPFDWADPPSSVPMAWRMIEGYPIFGYWDRPILGYDDANGDGILEDGEVLIGETPVFLGSSYPTQGATLSTAVTLWDRVRIGGLFEYRAGHVLLNETAWLRCAAGVCPERQDRATPLDRQVAAAARRWTLAGFVEDADYLKLREVSLRSWRRPPSPARSGRAACT
jgi:outer membrane receptor protein involved in Fe transport